MRSPGEATWGGVLVYLGRLVRCWITGHLWFQVSKDVELCPACGTFRARERMPWDSDE